MSSFTRLAALLLAMLATTFAHALPYTPRGFQTRTVTLADGATIHVRIGGHGPAVLLIHGFGDTGDMWGPLAEALAPRHTVIVPDLRGMGLSSHAPAGYEKRSQAADMRAVVEAVGQDRAVVVGHDIGTMVAYAYAARYPAKTLRLVVMDAPVPGVVPWNEIILWPPLWHFNFGGPNAERLVAGRERIYLDRFWNEFAGDPSKVDEATRAYYTDFYRKPGAMRASFAQFNAIAARDVADGVESSKTRLTMPVLAIGGEKSFGSRMAEVMRNAATDVREEVVPGAGHWLMEEAPAATVALVAPFVDEAQ